MDRVNIERDIERDIERERSERSQEEETQFLPTTSTKLQRPQRQVRMGPRCRLTQGL